MSRSAIYDQNNDNIVDEPKDILEEDVEDDDDIFPAHYDKQPNFWLF